MAQEPSSNRIAAHCALIIDGRRVENAACVIEIEDEAQTVGFLSAPSGTLEAAQTAKRIQIDVDYAKILEIRLLQVSGTVALVIVSKHDL